jgi:hypothetical protein
LTSGDAAEIYQDILGSPGITMSIGDSLVFSVWEMIGFSKGNDSGL